MSSRCLWLLDVLFFFFKQKTAYEMRISDWSSDVCSSDLGRGLDLVAERQEAEEAALGCAFGDPGDRSSLRFQPGRFDGQRRQSNALVLHQARAAEAIGRASCRERVCQYV